MPPHLGSDLGIDKAHDALQLILKLIAKPRASLAHTLFPGTLRSTLLIHWRHPFENSFVLQPATIVNPRNCQRSSFDDSFVKAASQWTLQRAVPSW
jgi:hypothetical protein